jgi:uncharacterized protein
MKQLFTTLLLFFFVGNLLAQKSIPKPSPMRLVNDNAKVLDAHDAEVLERRLIALDDSTSNQIVVLTVKSLNGEILEDVAVKTFREWGIGNKATNNGILLLIAIDDRKVRIEVGYGLEGAIPDVIANDIINNDIKPAFKQNNYLGGITKAVDNLSKAAAGEYKVKRKKAKRDGSGGGSILGFVIILFIILMIVGRGGGGRGGRRGRIDATDLILPMLFSGLGRGGSSGGGGWSAGGGGFGGFGGGSSGGGGASGGW